jgi:hypothetical protein
VNIVVVRDCLARLPGTPRGELRLHQEIDGSGAISRLDTRKSTVDEAAQRCVEPVGRVPYYERSRGATVVDWILSVEPTGP